MPHQEQSHEFNTSDPWLVIPYFPNDQGVVRPLSNISSVISWLCPSIKVSGVNYVAQPGSYIPNEPLSITVDVENLGIPGAAVTVTVYWADPSTSFSSLQSQIVATTSFSVPGRIGPVESPEMIWTPESSKIPEHFCLFAKATTFPYPYSVSSYADPMNDRHWAQFNLQTIKVSKVKKISSVFWVSNPIADFAAYNISVRPLKEEHLEILSRTVKVDPVRLKVDQVRIQHLSSVKEDIKRGDNSLIIELDGLRRLALLVSVDVPELPPHKFVALELLQTRAGTESTEGNIGSLGIVIFS